MIVILRGKEEYYNSLAEFEEKSGINRKDLKLMSQGQYIMKEDREILMLLEFTPTVDDIALMTEESKNYVKIVFRNHRRKLHLAITEERILSE